MKKTLVLTLLLSSSIGLYAMDNDDQGDPISSPSFWKSTGCDEQEAVKMAGIYKVASPYIKKVWSLAERKFAIEEMKAKAELSNAEQQGYAALERAKADTARVQNDGKMIGFVQDMAAFQQTQIEKLMNAALKDKNDD